MKNEQNRIKILLDVDTGVDDSLALLYALNKEEVEIVGITTVCGNVEARLAAENTLKILDLADAPDIPVVCGHEQPLEGNWEGRVTFIHGDNGLGNVELPPSGRTLLHEDVCDFQIRMAQKYENELVLVTLGSEGVFCRWKGQTWRQPGVPVQVADTNGAGDTFFGAVLSQLARREAVHPLDGLDQTELENILTFANRAAAVTCSRSGAIPAMPYLSELGLNS